MDINEIFRPVRIDFVQFIKKPSVILRTISVVLSIIEFSCIVAGSYEKEDCLYGEDTNACAYGVWIGILAFMIAVAFIITDLFYEKIRTSRERKIVTICDLVFCLVWSCQWFVCFCYLTHRWSQLDDNYLDKYSIPTWKINNTRSGIAFCFLSIPIWVALTILAFRNYRQIVLTRDNTSSTRDAPSGAIPDDDDDDLASDFSSYSPSSVKRSKGGSCGKSAGDDEDGVVAFNPPYHHFMFYRNNSSNDHYRTSNGKSSNDNNPKKYGKDGPAAVVEC